MGHPSLFGSLFHFHYWSHLLNMKELLVDLVEELAFLFFDRLKVQEVILEGIDVQIRVLLHLDILY